ncbi:MAG: Crp/Fnr family transcriptional regulator [Ruminococcaceae bacterium]|nr:Crp/Fnr family transcriptional regulator [Oscillospiraceae bacterium]
MNDTYRVMPILTENPLFSAIAPDTLEQMIHHRDCMLVTYRNGDTVFSETDYHHALGIVTRGSALVYRLGHGTPVLLTTLTKGHMFGVAGIFSEEDRYVTRIVAKGMCQVFYFPANLCESLIQNDPAFAMAYVRFLSDRIRFLNKRLAELSAPAVEQKLAKYFSECAERISPNMAELATSLGIGRASLYRTLDSFIRRGLIRKQEHDILILDPQGLRDLI